MPDGADDRDALIKDLIDESFGLRTKAEQLSQYVESKVAELVKTQMELEALEDGSKLHELNTELASLRHGLEEATKLRNDLQSRLDKLSKEHEELSGTFTAMTDQRDRLRGRLATIETSRDYRLAQRISRFLARLGKSS
jgi:chromosome segregation ATPase